MAKKSKRVTIKIQRRTYEQLAQMRKDTGSPISELMNNAVLRYAYPDGRRQRTRVRKLRGSR